LALLGAAAVAGRGLHGRSSLVGLGLWERDPRHHATGGPAVLAGSPPSQLNRAANSCRSSLADGATSVVAGRAESAAHADCKVHGGGAHVAIIARARIPVSRGVVTVVGVVGLQGGLDAATLGLTGAGVTLVADAAHGEDHHSGQDAEDDDHDQEL